MKRQIEITFPHGEVKQIGPCTIQIVKEIGPTPIFSEHFLKSLDCLGKEGDELIDKLYSIVIREVILRSAHVKIIDIA